MLKKIFYTIFGAAGAAAFLYGAWLFIQDARSAQWPATPGRILTSAYSQQSTDSGTTYGARVTYEYAVNDQRYVSDRISFGSYSSSDSGHARRILLRYPVGKAVAVFYNPNRPGMSVLEQGRGGAYILMGVGGAFVGFVLFMAWAGNKGGQIDPNPQLSLGKTGVVFPGKKNTSPGGREKKRIEVQRDRPRVMTNYPPAAIVLGVIFLIAGPALMTFRPFKGGEWLMILFGVFLSVAGGSLVWFPLKGLRLRRIRKEASGHSPWLYDHPWDRHGTTDHGFKQAFATLYALVMISIFLVPFHAVFLGHEQMPGARIFVYLVLGFFDLVLLAGYGKLLYLFMRARKFGKNRILYHSFPLQLGQAANVTFAAGERLRNQSLRAELQCICEYYETSGSGDSRSSRPVYELRYSQSCEFRTDGSGKAELTFQLPTDAPSTDLISSPPCYWELEISAKLRGIDYRGIFLMPVYKTT